MIMSFQIQYVGMLDIATVLIILGLMIAVFSFEKDEDEQ